MAFGAFYPSITKNSGFRADPEILEWWSSLMELPSVAIGGITPENALPLIEAGADFLAMSSAVWDADDGPTAGVEAFVPLLKTAASAQR